MLPLHNSSLPDVDASSPSLSHSTVFHKQVAAPSSLANLGGPTTISRSILHTSNTGVHHDDLVFHEPVFHARSDNLSLQQQLFPSHRCQCHSEPVTQTVATRAPSHYPFLSATGAQNRRRRRRFQRSVTPAFSNSATVTADRRCSTADTVNSPSWAYCRAEPLQRISDTVLTRDLPLMTAGDWNTPVVRYRPTFSDPFRKTIADARSGHTGFIAVPSAIAREDSVNERLAANLSESRDHVERMANGWKEDAKGVLIFTGIFSAIVASFIIESYKMLSPNSVDQSSSQPSLTPAVAIIIVNIMWLISLVLNIITALFATLTLQWARRYTQAPRAPRDHVHNSPFLFLNTLTYDMDRAFLMTIILLHLSVFLFLVGLVIFFFTINKIVATVVLIAVGLFGVVYFTLSILACIDRSCPYRTPLSDVWWSRRERLDHT